VTGKVRLTTATLAVLDAMAAHPAQWHHGYELLVSAGLKSGSLYPILRRLCEHGFLESAWEADAPPGRPPRHLYRLTPSGSELVASIRSQPSTAIRFSAQGAM
jgi:DNA-binding PadR family transcriptional regulator